MSRLTPLFEPPITKGFWHDNPDEILKAARDPGGLRVLRQCGNGWFAALNHRHAKLFHQLQAWGVSPQAPMGYWEPNYRRGEAQHTRWRPGNPETDGPAWAWYWAKLARSTTDDEPKVSGPWSTSWLLDQGFDPSPSGTPWKHWPLTHAVRHGWEATLACLLHAARRHHGRWPEGLLEHALPHPRVYAMLWESGARPSSKLADWAPFLTRTQYREDPITVMSARAFHDIAPLIQARSMKTERRTRRTDMGRAGFPPDFFTHFLEKTAGVKDPELGWALWTHDTQPATRFAYHVRAIEEYVGRSDEPSTIWYERAHQEKRWNWAAVQPATLTNLAQVLLRPNRGLMRGGEVDRLLQLTDALCTVAPELLTKPDRHGATALGALQAWQGAGVAVLPRVEAHLTQHVLRHAIAQVPPAADPSPAPRRIRL